MSKPFVLNTNKKNWFRSLPASITKYKWKMRPTLDYGNGYKLVQATEEMFILSGFRSTDRRWEKPLLALLKQYCPVDTGWMRSKYDVYLLQYKPGKWGLVISNRADYFRFPYHFYRGEMRGRRPKTGIRDFVQQATDDLMVRVQGG